MKNLFRRRRAISALGIIGATCLLVCTLLLTTSSAQQFHRDHFETLTPAWIKGNADVAFAEKGHSRVDKGSKDGQRCEFIQVEAQRGNFIHYYYPTEPAPVNEELSVGVYVRSNRRGLQVLARVVLPNERDPKSLEARLTTIIQGESYTSLGRWQKLHIPRAALLAKRQQQLMQADLKRTLNFKDAYVDRIILNIYGGPGDNQVWIDTLQIGPIIKRAPINTAKPDAPGPASPFPQPKRTARTATVEFSGSQLLVGGKRFFFRGIRHTDTPLNVLRNAGFNTVWMAQNTNRDSLREASSLGFWLVPSVPTGSSNGQLVSRNAVGNEVSRFPFSDSVLFWDLGKSLTYSPQQVAFVDRSARLVKAVDTGRPVGADVWDGFNPYSRSLDLVGAHRWPLMTDLEMADYREWLNQRRLLANPGTFMWTWIQNHTPEFYTRLLYEQPANSEFKMPVGPQPAQVRLLSYTALGAGCRGLAFWSDRFLADSHFGRDRLLECALLNKELEMLEPLLLTIEDPPQWVSTSQPDVRAAVFRTAKGVLVLPMWLGKGAQFVPGQSAATKLKIVVPAAPPGNQAWEVTPGEVRALKVKRVHGGTEIVLPEFGLTSAVVFTSDIRLVARFQEHCRAVRQLAAQWTTQQAEQEIRKVTMIQKLLEQQGKALPRSPMLLNQAMTRLQTAKVHWDNRLFGDAYREAQRSLRPLRILMRAQWDKATEVLDSPVALPYAVSYYTLPQHWQMVDQLRATTPAADQLRSGGFETSPDQRQSGWTPQYVKLDDVRMSVERVGADVPSSLGEKVKAKSGNLCAMLQIQPAKKGDRIGALERTYLALSSPAVKLQPGSLVRISGWVYIPRTIQASVDGVLFYDSAGGEPLSVRLTGATEWKKISLYRRVPNDGNISVTMALSGIGIAYFDDVRIEPLVTGR